MLHINVELEGFPNHDSRGFCASTPHYAQLHINPKMCSATFSDDTQNILLPKAVDVPTVTVVPAGALQSVAQPAVGNPSLDLVVVLTVIKCPT